MSKCVDEKFPSSVNDYYFNGGIRVSKTKKAMGKLKKISNTYIGRDLRFFCPEETLTISCKITCQSLNFICQTLEESLQSAYQSYRLKECICF